MDRNDQIDKILDQMIEKGELLVEDKAESREFLKSEIRRRSREKLSQIADELTDVALIQLMLKRRKDLLN